ncbi:PadR family transcriptional regulator [Micromonospora sp. CPCC 206061]|uniref:PadR family transcriptional regulator n=1 Tax=Micromonospora sp. CPCC 206061 TaxID=3122410 RepID=UPI002FEEB943
MLTTLALVVLELLHERPMHPYEIQQMIRDRYIDHVVKVRAGSLYHTVDRLHRSELIEPIETARAGRRPERTVYAITETGRDEFGAGLRELVREPRQEYPAFAAGLEMLHTIDGDEAAEMLARRCVRLEAEIAAYAEVLAGVMRRGVPRAGLIEVEYAQAMRQAELTWIRGLIDDIQSGALPWDAEKPEETR